MLAVKMLMALSKGNGIDLNLSITLSMMVQYLIAMPIAILIIKQVPSSKIPGRKMRIPDFFTFFIMLYPIAFVGNIVGRIVNSLISSAFHIPIYNPVDLILSRTNPFLMIFLVGILAPVLEEFMTRKLIIDRTVEYGQGISVVFSATVFSLIHGNFYQSFYAFGLGACFAFIYIKTGSLKYSSIMHMIINSGSVLLMLLLKGSGMMPYIENPEITDMELMMSRLTTTNYISMFLIFIYFMVYLVIMIMGIVFWAKKAKKLRLQKGSLSHLPKSEQTKILFFNWGMLIFILLSLYTFVDNIMMAANLS